MAELALNLPPLEAETTPLMAQYLALKAAHPDALLFFRLGDFYELFFDDAVTAARTLDITLTRRGQHQGQDIPMCGVPFHSYENYLARLIRAGHRVAISEQMEDPAAAKKRGGKSIVQRAVVRVVTPGTLTEDTLLESRAHNHLAVLCPLTDGAAVAWIDLSAGAPQARSVTRQDTAALLERLNPSEILLPQAMADDDAWRQPLAAWQQRFLPLPAGRFDAGNAAQRLRAVYGVESLTGFGDFTRAETTALGVLLDYAALTQKQELAHLAPPQREESDAGLLIDAATARNLELTRTLGNERRGSLLDAIDMTTTGAGARLLGAWLTAPLSDRLAIEARLDAVAAMITHSALRTTLHDRLRQCPDLERAVARLALNRGGPRDLAAVRDALVQAEALRSQLLAMTDLPSLLQQQRADLGNHADLIETLQQALAANPPMLARDGNFIAPHFMPALDELRTLRDDSQRLIAALQQTYATQSGIAGLKIRHNNIIGYFIEVTPLHADKLMAQPETFIHRQTMAGAVRFTTVALNELERKVAGAAASALELELKLFVDLAQRVTSAMPDLRRTAAALARLDVFAGLATLATLRGYVRPTIHDDGRLHIKGGRHPVVEQALEKNDGARFITNDCQLDDNDRLWLITGPNMAGKSTFLRQNALIVLLAQMGAYVPATMAAIGIVDRLFSRVGAADDLARGRSTFMVEMVETAAILHQATARSLVILDEIGRGTATFDGMALAWAVIEQLHNTTRCRALFATHYHELTSLQGRLAALSCHTSRIKEWQGDIIFLHEMTAGTADKSYGLHVAKLAGLPAPVLTRAAQILMQLETAEKRDLAALPDPAPAAPPHPALEKLANINPDTLSPRDALDALYALKKLTK